MLGVLRCSWIRSESIWIAILEVQLGSAMLQCHKVDAINVILLLRMASLAHLLSFIVNDIPHGCSIEVTPINNQRETITHVLISRF